MGSFFARLCSVRIHLCGRYVDQGGGKRPGAFAIYMEPWHADVFEVLEMKKNHGKEELRARYSVASGSEKWCLSTCHEDALRVIKTGSFGGSV